MGGEGSGRKIYGICIECQKKIRIGEEVAHLQIGDRPGRINLDEPYCMECIGNLTAKGHIPYTKGIAVEKGEVYSDEGW